MLVVGLFDLTVLNLALPSIATALHASTSDLQWFNDAYSLVLAAAVLPACSVTVTAARSADDLAGDLRRELGRLLVRHDLG